jgi:hypothetical protein
MAKNQNDKRKRAESDARTEMAFAGGGQGDISLERRNPLQVYNRESNMLEDQRMMPNTGLMVGIINKARQRYPGDVEIERIYRGEPVTAMQYLDENNLLDASDRAALIRAGILQ